MVSMIIYFELDAVNYLLSMLSNSLLKPFALLLGLITPVLHSRLLQYLMEITTVLGPSTGTVPTTRLHGYFSKRSLTFG